MSCCGVAEKMRKDSLTIRLLGIAGPPGSGKTTYVSRMVEHLIANGVQAVGIPMDGFHIPRAQIMRIGGEALMKRRGAPETFDARAFTEHVQRVKARERVAFPGFDHATKDPSPDRYTVHPCHELVIFEGIYLALNREIWRDLPFDALWFIEVDRDLAIRRLVKRHVEAGICPDEKSSMEKTINYDMVHYDIVMNERRSVDRVISQREAFPEIDLMERIHIAR